MMLPNVQRRQPIYFNIKFLFQKKKLLYFSKPDQSQTESNQISRF